MVSELKPCHKCESRPILLHSDVNEFGVSAFVYVCCNCGHETKVYNSEEEARDDWNTRPVEDALLEALKTIVRMDNEAGEVDVDIYKLACLSRQMIQIAEEAIAKAEGKL